MPRSYMGSTDGQEAYNNLGDYIRKTVYALPDMRMRGARTQVRDKLIRISKRVDEFQAELERSEKRRIEVEKQLIYLENLKEMREMGAARRHKYSRTMKPLDPETLRDMGL